MKNRAICLLGRIPKGIRLPTAWVLIGLGFLLFLTPFPGGVFLIVSGSALLGCVSPALQSRTLRTLPFGNSLSRRMAHLFQACDSCTQATGGRKRRRPGASCALDAGLE